MDLLDDLLHRPEVMIIADVGDDRVMDLGADLMVAYTRAGGEDVPAAVKIELYCKSFMTGECLQREVQRIIDSKQKER